MGNALFLTPGPITWASSRYRAYWVAECMGNADVHEYSKFGEFAINHDAAIFVKVAANNLAVELKDCGYKVAWDICDPVHWFNPREARTMADSVDFIIASNAGLAKDFSAWYLQKPIHVIQDRLKLDHYPFVRQHSPQDIVRLVWFGASQNRHALIGCIPTIKRLTANGVNLSVTIYDDHPEDAWRLEDIPTYHGRWDLAQENTVIASHDIALLPPYPGAWGAVKSNNRSLTAWACGLPVWDGIDYTHGYELATMATARATEAEKGYRTLQREYNIEQSAIELERLLWG